MNGFGFQLLAALILVCSHTSFGKRSHRRQQKQDKPITYGGTAQQFSYIANRLWSLDSNRLKVGTDVRLQLQGQASWSNKNRDYASRPLFLYVNQAALKKPTFKAFMSLLDNYISEVNQKEQITQGEISESYTFLNAILATPVMKEAHRYLVQMGKSSRSIGQFKGQLYDLWFKPYYRSSANKIPDSSGFEHVFVGETNSRLSKVLGFHSWLQFYRQERDHHINYLGFLKKGNNPNLLMTQFKWNGEMKQVGSFFVGTSPEFEIALYTISYLMDFNNLKVSLAGASTKITCFGINRDRSIGTCYPDIA